MIGYIIVGLFLGLALFTGVCFLYGLALWLSAKILTIPIPYMRAVACAAATIIAMAITAGAGVLLAVLGSLIYMGFFGQMLVVGSYAWVFLFLKLFFNLEWKQWLPLGAIWIGLMWVAHIILIPVIVVVMLIFGLAFATGAFA